VQRNVSLATFNPFDAWNTTRFAEDNFAAVAGDVAFTLVARDALGNVRAVGGDTFQVEILRQELVGQALGGSASALLLPEDASTDDGAYNGRTLDITHGAGAGQRVTVGNYLGAAREALAAFAVAPGPSSRFALGARQVLSTDLSARLTVPPPPPLVLSGHAASLAPY